MNDENRGSDSAIIWIVLLVTAVLVAALAGGAGWLIARQRMAAEMQVREEMLRAQEEMLRMQAVREAQLAEDAARREHEAALEAREAAGDDASSESAPEAYADDGTTTTPADTDRPGE